MQIFEWNKDNFLISNNKSKLDVAYIHAFLTSSYWAKGISLAQVQTEIEHSICFGLFEEGQQKGFARVITDFVSFAYLCDVFIDPAYRKRGLSKWLLDCIFSIPEFKQICRWTLTTADAHALYKKVGFLPFAKPGSQMEMINLDAYL